MKAGLSTAPTSSCHGMKAGLSTAPTSSCHGMKAGLSTAPTSSCHGMKAGLSTAPTSSFSFPVPMVLSHFECCFPAPSSKLCQKWLRHWKDTLYLHAAASERFGYQSNCGNSIASKHARKHEVHVPQVKKNTEVLSWFKQFWFYLCWHKQCGRL